MTYELKTITTYSHRMFIRLGLEGEILKVWKKVG